MRKILALYAAAACVLVSPVVISKLSAQAVSPQLGAKAFPLKACWLYNSSTVGGLPPDPYIPSEKSYVHYVPDAWTLKDCQLFGKWRGAESVVAICFWDEKAYTRNVGPKDFNNRGSFPFAHSFGRAFLVKTGANDAAHVPPENPCNWKTGY